jgi:hypothetical protein
MTPQDANDSKYTAAAEKAATLGRVKQADMYMYKADHPIWQVRRFSPMTTLRAAEGTNIHEPSQTLAERW